MLGHNKGLHMVTWILVIVGGLNWLLFGLFGWEVGALFGGMETAIAKIIYILVGLSAIYELTCHKKICKMCEGMSSPTPPPPAGM